MTAQPVDPPEPDEIPRGDSLSLEIDFAELTAVLDRLSVDCDARMQTDPTPDAAVLLLDDLRTAHKRLGEMVTFAEQAAINRLDYGKQNVAGFIAEVKGGATKPGNWQHDKVAWAVIEATLVDKETGAVDPADFAVAGKVRDAILNCAGIRDWRVTQLRPLGIDPSDFSERVPSKRSVILTKADGEAES